MKYYLAYGSNCNITQMVKNRCKTAKLVGVGYLQDFRLTFIRVATVVPHKGEITPLVIWTIEENDEVALDKYEGTASGLYRKEYMKVKLENGKEIEGLIYILNKDSLDMEPSKYYFETIMQGYLENNLTVGYLLEAYQRSCKGRVSKEVYFD